MTISERMFQLLDEKGKKAKDLADFLHVNSGQISMWKKRNADPKAEQIFNICEFLGVTPEYLLTGKESPPSSDPDDPMLSQIISLYKKLSDVQRGELIGYARRMVEEQEIIEGNIIPSNGTGGTKKDTTPPVAAESVAG